MPAPRYRPADLERQAATIDTKKASTGSPTHGWFLPVFYVVSM
jgi:hypothetical protein